MDYKTNCAVGCASNNARYNKLRCNMQHMICALENYRQLGTTVNVLSLNTQGEMVHNAYNEVYRATYKAMDARDCMDITIGMIARVEELLKTCERKEIEDMEPVIPSGVLDAVMPFGGLFQHVCESYSDYM